MKSIASLFSVVAVTFAFAIGIAHVDKQSIELRAQAPVETPAPVVAPTELPPTPALVAVIDGPAKSSSTFYWKVEVNPAAVNTWTKVFPIVDGKMIEPMVWPGRVDGSEMWIFQEPPQGVYYIKLRSQLPSTGLDPIVDLEHATIVGTAITPPTTPTDPTNPTTPTDPNVPDGEQAKVKEPGFRCLLLYEASRGIPNAFADPKVRSYLTSKVVKGADGKTPDWRMKDNDEVVTGDFPVWKLYRDTLPPGTDEKPYVSCGDGVRGFAGPAPATGTELLTLLQKYGGN